MAAPTTERMADAAAANTDGHPVPATTTGASERPPFRSFR